MGAVGAVGAGLDFELWGGGAGCSRRLCSGRPSFSSNFTGGGLHPRQPLSSPPPALDRGARPWIVDSAALSGRIRWRGRSPEGTPAGRGPAGQLGRRASAQLLRPWTRRTESLLAAENGADVAEVAVGARWEGSAEEAAAAKIQWLPAVGWRAGRRSRSTPLGIRTSYRPFRPAAGVSPLQTIAGSGSD